MKPLLKRFSILENPANNAASCKPRAETKRFQKLEVNNQVIELALEEQCRNDTSAPVEQAAEGGAQNPAPESLKRCSCGALNVLERKNCSSCGKNFFTAETEQSAVLADPSQRHEQENIIVLTLNGSTYRSSDPSLPFPVYDLMQRIRKYGYSQELVNQWTEEQKESLQRNLTTKKFRIGFEIFTVGSQIVIGLLGLLLIVFFILYPLIIKH